MNNPTFWVLAVNILVGSIGQAYRETRANAGIGYLASSFTTMIVDSETRCHVARVLVILWRMPVLLRNYLCLLQTAGSVFAISYRHT
ncbi:hypothetical protein EV421DRAFT_1805906 [Armillaria borealis]|uniref:Uncharacterized protein n=1 Tax=Armillaria borealis TaxID=47425 RepID=A0AA39JK77_9AGAR|nr:hypothetical protein EV421DRAFT_1805906 [Armillaria borealis]